MTIVIPETPSYSGCVWPIDKACLGDAWDGLDPLIQERSLALASETLRRLTGYRVGGCPVTVRPCSPSSFDRAFIPFRGSYGTGWINPGVNASGLWVNGCGCASSCDCTTTCEINLPAPVGLVYEVKVDGIALDPTDYRVDNGHILVWTGGGECPFPANQNLSLPDTEAGTFSITYLNAYPVDVLGAQAATYLAMEFAKACGAKGKCGLPRNVTDVVRNGISFTIQAGLFPEGRTSIDVVDAYIEMWNPNHMIQSATVWTPDMPRHRVMSNNQNPPLPPDGILDGGGA